MVCVVGEVAAAPVEIKYTGFSESDLAKRGGIFSDFRRN